MRSADGRYTLVYNGEIYNYQELRQRLENGGVTFRTETDTEVLLQALIHWGKETLPRLTGMFALALFDAERRTLFCARDCFGIKPFFWYRGSMGFCFASEIPALLRFPQVPSRADPTAAYQYLCYGQYDTGDTTMLADIFALPPAHYVEVSLDAPAEVYPQRWWKPNIADSCPLSYADASIRLRELFLESIHLHIPLCFLPLHCSPGRSSPSFQILVMNPGFFMSFCKGTPFPVKPCFFRYLFPTFRYEQAAYVPLPKFCTFKSRDGRERIPYKKFVQVGQDVRRMVKDVLNQCGAK